MRDVTPNKYRGMRRAVREALADYAEAKARWRDVRGMWPGRYLEGRGLLAREDAVGRCVVARERLADVQRRLAAAQPVGGIAWSPAAHARHRARHRK